MLEFVCVSSISEVSPQIWNEILSSNVSKLSQSYPFLRHEFLLALEQCNITTAEQGWETQHVLIYEKSEKEETRVIGFMPMYLKAHSYGEFVFDQSWAEAYYSYGLHYYPKLVSAIPFSPVQGPRIIVHVDLMDDEARYKNLLVQLTAFVDELMDKREILSWHVLYDEEKLSQDLALHSVKQRLNVNFHWFNRGYNNYDDFVAALNSRKRKSLRKERLSIFNKGVNLRRIEGVDISDEQWDSFYQFYCNTYLRKSGHDGYLNKQFFKSIGNSIPENLLLVLAYDREENVIAGALNFKDGESLYGRYWGCNESYAHLHFETCYYQGVEYCIENKLKKFDPGVQGEHKIQRGFEPVYTYSNHLLRQTVLSEAIDNFLLEERGYLAKYKLQTEKLLPFKQNV